MKKIILSFLFSISIACVSLAQDTTHKTPTHHKSVTHKPADNIPTAVPDDSVKAGAVTTNPNGKTASGSPPKAIHKKAKTVNTSRSHRADSTK